MNNENIKNTNENVSPEDVLTTVADVKRAIEAILFAAGYPVRYDKLGEVLGLTEKDVRLLVEDMALSYNSEDSERGILLLLLPETCQLSTKERFMPYIREALGIRRGGNLSASSLEVLAVVAYNQPVTRSFIDQVRGVDSSYAVNSLIDKNLIESCGRLDAPGRPMLYATTDKFLRVFGFSSLDDLPKTEPLVDPSSAPEEQDDSPTVIVEGENDGDVKIADGKITVPEKPESAIDLSRKTENEGVSESGSEIENSTL